MSGYSGLDKEAADLAAALIRFGPLDRINDTITHAVELCPSIETVIREKSLGLPKLVFDPEAGRYFIASPFNNLGESYRSPWTDTWLPPIPEAGKPAAHLRQLEHEFNAVYDAYREAHYGAGVSSVYSWPLQNQDGFAAAFLLLKEIPIDEDVRPLCFFFHRLEVTLTATNAHYKVSSCLLMQTPCTSLGSLKGGVAALLSRSVEQTQKVLDARAAATAGSGTSPMGPQHLAVGGPLIERNEASLLDDAAQTQLPRTEQMLKQLTTPCNRFPALLQVVEELEASRPASSYPSLT